MMNSNALHAATTASNHHATDNITNSNSNAAAAVLSESTLFILRIFVRAMTVICCSLLLLTAMTEPGIVYNLQVLKLLRKEHVKQQQKLRTLSACWSCLLSPFMSMSMSSKHHRNDDLHDIMTSDDDDDEDEVNRLDEADNEVSSSTDAESETKHLILDDDSEALLKSKHRPHDITQTWKLKNLPFCSVCNVLTPESKNIYHCQDCGFCIEHNDHHCPWMGQCIGKHNMA